MILKYIYILSLVKTPIHLYKKWSMLREKQIKKSILFSKDATLLLSKAYKLHSKNKSD